MNIWPMVGAAIGISLQPFVYRHGLFGLEKWLRKRLPEGRL